MLKTGWMGLLPVSLYVIVIADFIWQCFVDDISNSLIVHISREIYGFVTQSFQHILPVKKIADVHHSVAIKDLNMCVTKVSCIKLSDPWLLIHPKPTLIRTSTSCSALFRVLLPPKFTPGISMFTFVFLIDYTSKKIADGGLSVELSSTSKHHMHYDFWGPSWRNYSLYFKLSSYRRCLSFVTCM